MLVIRDAQLSALGKARWRDFVDRACAYVRGHWPARVDVLPAVERALSRGRGYGLETEFDLLRYVAVAFALGADFDRDARYPWGGEVLNAATYGPRTKMDLVWQLMEAEFGPTPGATTPTEYDDAGDRGADAAEPPDEEVMALDDEVPPFEPESEAPELMPDDIPFSTSDDDVEAAV